MKSERVKSLVSLLKYGGLWFKFNRYPRIIFAFQLFRFVYLVVGWIFMINLIFSEGIKFLLTPSAVFIPLGFNVIISNVLYFIEIKNVLRLVEECDKNLSSYGEDWEKNIIREETKRINFISNCFNYGMSCFAIFYMAFPLIVNFYRLVVGDPERYSPPLPFDGYLDDTKSRNYNFFLVTLVSDLWIAFGIPNSVSVHGVVFYIVSCTVTEINIIKKYLEKLYIEDGRYEILPDWDMGRIIEKHNQMLRVNELQNQSIALPTIVCCRILFTFSICFVMFMILQLFGKDTIVMIMAFVFIMMLLGLALVLCSAGEILEQQSDGLFYAVCRLPWYRQSPKSRKTYSLLIRQTSKTLALDYAFTNKMNFNCYMQVVNSSFSYFMIMQSLNE